MNNTLSIAVAQPLAVPGDCAENINRMEPLIAEAKRRGAEVVLFSECAITGYDLKNVGVNAAIPLDDPQMKRLARLAKRYDVVIVAGLYERNGDTIHNSAVAQFPDGRTVVQRKHNVIAMEKDNTPTVPGDRARTYFDIKGFKTAILICADSGIPNIFEELAENGCDLVLCPTAGCGTVEWGFREADVQDAAGRARYIDSAEKVCFLRGFLEKGMELGMSIASANQAGWIEETGFFQPGHSAVVDKTGEIVALIPGRMIAEHVKPDVAVGTVHK